MSDARAYYNEIDPFAAAWLRALIDEGQIAKGDVDERDIREVRPEDVRGHTQCHWFAGIGVWPYALRLAGWSDDTAVWTGSCPCQPFSAAGRQRGFDDERHLWPEWFRLIRVCRPPVVFGEQVGGKAGRAWLDLVSADLEGAGYAVGAADIPACSLGAPHIRQRLWLVADAGCQRRQQISRGASGDEAANGRTGWNGSEPNHDYLAPGHGADGLLADASNLGHERARRARGGRCGSPHRRADGLLGNTGRAGLARPSRQSGDDGEEQPAAERAGGAVGGFWRDAEWIWCRDGRWRPVEPGSFPLAHGAPARVGRLRGYGNAIVAPTAAEFIRAYIEARRMSSDD